MTIQGQVTIQAGYPEMYDDIARLYNAVSGLDNPDHADLDGSFFESSYTRLGLDLQKHVVNAVTVDGKLVGTGNWRPNAENKTDTYMSIMVHPDFRRRGIGSAILSRIELFAREEGIETLTCNIPSYQKYSIEFAEHRGFRRVTTWIKLVHHDTTRIGRPSQLKGLQIREMQDYDAKTWADMQNAIFANNYRYTNVSEATFLTIRSRADFDPDLFLLGLVDNRPAAYCLGIVFTPPTDVSERRLLIQGIGVYPEFRGNGYGRIILEEVLWRAAQKGIRRSELVVDEKATAARGLYKRVGYERRYDRIWYTKEIH